MSSWLLASALALDKPSRGIDARSQGHVVQDLSARAFTQNFHTEKGRSICSRMASANKEEIPTRSRVLLTGDIYLVVLLRGHVTPREPAIIVPSGKGERTFESAKPERPKRGGEIGAEREHQGAIFVTGIDREDKQFEYII